MDKNLDRHKFASFRVPTYKISRIRVEYNHYVYRLTVSNDSHADIM